MAHIRTSSTGTTNVIVPTSAAVGDLGLVYLTSPDSDPLVTTSGWVYEANYHTLWDGKHSYVRIYTRRLASADLGATVNSTGVGSAGTMTFLALVNIPSTGIWFDNGVGGAAGKIEGNFGTTTAMTTGVATTTTARSFQLGFFAQTTFGGGVPSFSTPSGTQLVQTRAAASRHRSAVYVGTSIRPPGTYQLSSTSTLSGASANIVALVKSPLVINLDVRWDGIALTVPATQTARSLHFQARARDDVSTGDWVDYAYNVADADGTGLLTIQPVSTEGIGAEIRGIVYYDYNETPHYGAFPTRLNEWPVTALLGAFGRDYQIRFAGVSAVGEEFTPTGYVGVPEIVLAFGYSGVTDGGIFATVDGESWVARSSGYDSIAGSASDRAHGTLLACDNASPASLMRSVDNGLTWAVDSFLVHPSLGTKQVLGVTFANGTFIVVYSLNSLDLPTSTDYTFAFSTDGGNSWQFSMPISSAYLVSPPVWTGSHWFCVVEMHTSAVPQSFGIFRSSDLVSWSQQAAPTLLAGDTSWYFVSGNYAWSSGPSKYVRIVISEGTGGVFSFNGTRLLYTIDGGSTATLAKPSFANAYQYLRAAWRNPVTGTVVGAVRESSFLLGGSVEHTTMWRSTDDGLTWSFAADSPTDSSEVELATFNQAGDMFLLVGWPNEQVYVSRDDGLTFAPFGSQPSPLVNLNTGGIEVVPGPARVFFDFPYRRSVSLELSRASFDI